jgi:hypothetical protein
LCTLRCPLRTGGSISSLFVLFLTFFSAFPPCRRSFRPPSGPATRPPGWHRRGYHYLNPGAGGSQVAAAEAGGFRPRGVVCSYPRAGSPSGSARALPSGLCGRGRRSPHCGGVPWDSFCRGPSSRGRPGSWGRGHDSRVGGVWSFRSGPIPLANVPGSWWVSRRGGSPDGVFGDGPPPIPFVVVVVGVKLRGGKCRGGPPQIKGHSYWFARGDSELSQPQAYGR